MKKLLIVILSFLYLSASTGAAIHFHYCMGELAGWEFGQDQVTTCSNCGMDKSTSGNTGCCRDEQSFFKTTTDQKTEAQGITLPRVSSTTLLFPLFTSMVNTTVVFHTASQSYEESPPGKTVPLFLKNRILLI